MSDQRLEEIGRNLGTIFFADAVLIDLTYFQKHGAHLKDDYKDLYKEVVEFLESAKQNSWKGDIEYLLESARNRALTYKIISDEVTRKLQSELKRETTMEEFERYVNEIYNSYISTAKSLMDERPVTTDDVDRLYKLFSGIAKRTYEEIPMAFRHG